LVTTVTDKRTARREKGSTKKLGGWRRKKEGTAARSGKSGKKKAYQMSESPRRKGGTVSGEFDDCAQTLGPTRTGIDTSKSKKGRDRVTKKLWKEF